MRFRSTGILLFVAGLALAYFFFVEQPRHRREVGKTEQLTELTHLETGDITRFAIVRPDHSLEFERRDIGWRMLQPAPDTADPSPVNKLLHTMTTARIGKRFAIRGTDPARLVQYGLDLPAAVIRVETPSDENALTVHVGDYTLTKSHCYGRTDSAEYVVLLPAGLRRYALGSVFDFRDKRIAEISVPSVKRLKVVSDGRAVDWTRDATGEWMIEIMGDVIRGDRTAIDNIIREIRGLRAIELPLHDAGDWPKAGTIDLWIDSVSDVLTLTFGTETEGRCPVKTSTSDRIALVDATVLAIFKKTHQELRDRRLLKFDRESVSKVTFQTVETTTTIRHSATGWSFSNPEFGFIDQEAADALVSRIEGLRYTSILEERLRQTGGYGFADPGYRLAVFDSDDRMIDELRVGTSLPNGTQSYVTSVSTGILASVETTLLTELLEGFRNIGTE